MQVVRQWRVLGEKKMMESEGGQPGLEKRRKRRFRPGTVALQEIHKFQKSTSFLIRKPLFVKWVREIV